MKKHHSFTLIETVVVMFIMALVAGVGSLFAAALGTNQGVSTRIGNEP
ncbi:MAG: prepilin-type N-terminal cleavage/methylation domain-containing protein [Gammaproteobacteria bacterium]|nr:prepilin-type N-terminal cleavage/methylation domain-containing protein [Gammaproteobacteria bacterium]